MSLVHIVEVPNHGGYGSIIFGVIGNNLINRTSVPSTVRVYILDPSYVASKVLEEQQEVTRVFGWETFFGSGSQICGQ